MKNFVQPGDVLTLTAPYDVTSGGGFLVGSIFAIACATAASGADVEGKICGVFDLVAATHATDQAIAAGAPVYWDNSAKVATATATGNKRIGRATVAKASTAATVRVLLDETMGVVQAQGAHVADAAGGSDAAALVTKVNALLASLRSTGVIASS